jgi:hypothetical protein
LRRFNWRHEPVIGQRPWLHNTIMDKPAYDANGCAEQRKSPTDDIPNEIKMLPPKLHECIHMMFTLMWATGITPQLEGKPHLPCTKNKGEPTDITKYRPVGPKHHLQTVHSHSHHGL